MNVYCVWIWVCSRQCVLSRVYALPMHSSPSPHRSPRYMNVYEREWAFNVETYFLRRLRRNVVLMNFCGRLKGSNTRGVSWNLKDKHAGNYWGILLFKRCMRGMWGVVGVVMCNCDIWGILLFKRCMRRWLGCSWGWLCVIVIYGVFCYLKDVCGDDVGVYGCILLFKRCMWGWLGYMGVSCYLKDVCGRCGWLGIYGVSCYLKDVCGAGGDYAGRL
jgi:hypothetical protein